MQIQCAEHDPCPQHDAEINLAHQLAFLLGRPFEVWIEAVAVLVARAVVDAAPVVGYCWVGEDVLVGGAVALRVAETLLGSIVSLARAGRTGRADVFQGALGVTPAVGDLFCHFEAERAFWGGETLWCVPYPWTQEVGNETR